MPRYTPDPSKATSSFPIFPAGLYRVEITDVKSFASKDKKDPNIVTNHGVRLSGKVIVSEDNPTFVGKPFPLTCYMHTEGAENYSKGIINKVLGLKDDAAFEESPYKAMDWSYNTDDGSVGEGWHALKGKIVDVNCGEPAVPEKSQTGDLQTVIKGYVVAM